MDLSKLTPADAAVTLRGLERRYRGLFSGVGDDETPDDAAHRRVDGWSAIDHVVAAARAIGGADRGFTVIGVPCNQFMGQEPGTAEEIATFCSSNYGVTFPLTEKVEVNGEGRHPLYQQLVDVADSADGHTGDIRWNFEKFLIAPGGEVVARFNPAVEPTSDEVVGQVEKALPA